ncbi:MAG: hypothetical protein ACLGIO_09205, partial [Acidimicrobiia bacterium]
MRLVRLVDLEVFKRYSLAIRQESAPVEDVLAVLEATLRQVRSVAPPPRQAPATAGPPAGDHGGADEWAPPAAPGSAAVDGEGGAAPAGGGEPGDKPRRRPGPAAASGPAPARRPPPAPGPDAPAPAGEAAAASGPALARRPAPAGPMTCSDDPAGRADELRRLIEHHDVRYHQL